MPSCTDVSYMEKKHDVQKLLDLSAKVVAESIPFQFIENLLDPIPEPVQYKIVFYSFPRNERDIYMYSSYSTLDKESKNHNSNQSNIDYREKIPYYQGLKILDNPNSIQNALQVGFHLSGNVTDSTCLDGTFYKVCITFDRCKIVSVSCECATRDIFWCQHVVALSLYRIRQPLQVQLRVPISESLLQMNREQLQKFAQYLIAEHANQVLPTAQRIADEILTPRSFMNMLRGAPDPTAGASVDQANTWHLNEEQARQAVKLYLERGPAASQTQIMAMLNKVREMLRVRDSNGLRLLTIITEELFRDPRLAVYRSRRSMSLPARATWEELTWLWTAVLLDPGAGTAQRKVITAQLHRWNNQPSCPLEDVSASTTVGAIPTDEEVGAAEEEAEESQTPQRTVFRRALEAAQLNWDNVTLKDILSGSLTGTSALWREELAIAAARVDALRCNGHQQAALRLVVATIRALEQEQDCQVEQQPHVNGWADLAGEPLSRLVDALLEVSVVPRPGSPLVSLTNEHRTYIHREIPEECPPASSYLCLALRVALRGLLQQRQMPRGLARQEKALVQEERLMDRLRELHLAEPVLLNSLINLTREALCAGWSGLAARVPTESYPMHATALFLFKSLLPHQPELAYNVGLRALRLPVLENLAESEEPSDVSALLMSRYPRWFVLRRVELRQCDLAVALFEHAAVVHSDHSTSSTSSSTTNSANSSSLTPSRLDHLLMEADQHVHSASMLFKLSQDVFQCGGRHLVQASFQLALCVTRRTLSTVNWRRREMVRWAVSCAAECGLEAMLHALHRWPLYFTPMEATSAVAPCLLAPSSLMQLAGQPAAQEQLWIAVRQLALQAAGKDPVNCGLAALTLTDKEPQAFEAGYQLVVSAAERGLLNPCQLFTLARYLDHRGCPRQAFRLALLAMRALHLPSHQEGHPAVADVHWACLLAHSLGREELQQMLDPVIKNVHCPTVLAEVLQRAAMAPPGAASKPLAAHQVPLKPLLEAVMAAFVTTAHARLAHISPRHYTEFIDFLTKARDAFHLQPGPEGARQFGQLLDTMRQQYKGKKKLLYLIRDRFGV